jgi:aspartate/glutamate racemase
MKPKTNCGREREYAARRRVIAGPVEILAALRERGAEPAILACAELPLVITDEDARLPFIDTTRLLARTALARSLTTS